MELDFFHEELLNYSACIQTLHLRSRSYRVVMLEKSFMLNKFSCIKPVISYTKIYIYIYINDLCTVGKIK